MVDLDRHTICSIGTSEREQEVFCFVKHVLLDKVHMVVVGGQVPLMTQKQGYAHDMGLIRPVSSHDE